MLKWRKMYMCAVSMDGSVRVILEIIWILHDAIGFGLFVEKIIITDTGGKRCICTYIRVILYASGAVRYGDGSNSSGRRNFGERPFE